MTTSEKTVAVTDWRAAVCTTCSTGGCERASEVRGMCRTHYMRWRKDGGETGTCAFRSLSLADRFWMKVQKTDGCWIWTAARAHGYGVFGVNGNNRQAHIVAYELEVGPVPAGLDLDHLCRNRGCVRPDHLEPVTRRVNLLRGETIAAVHAAKTHCPQGHPYSGDNLAVRMKKYGPTRNCRACDREKARLRRACQTVDQKTLMGDDDE